MKKYALLFVLSFLGCYSTFAQGEFEGAFYGVLDSTNQSREDILDSIALKYPFITDNDEESIITLTDIDNYLQSLQYDEDHPIGETCEELPIPKCFTCEDYSNPNFLLRWQSSPIAGRYFGGHFDLWIDDVSEQLNPVPAVLFPGPSMAYKLITYGRRCDGGSQSSYSIIIIDEEILLANFLEFLDAQPEPLSESIEEEAIAESFTRLSPNPFNDFCKIEFSVPKSTSVSLHLVEATTGRIIRQEFRKSWMEADTYIHQINGKGLSPGMYFSILQIGEDQQIEKIIKIE